MRLRRQWEESNSLRKPGQPVLGALLSHTQRISHPFLLDMCECACARGYVLTFCHPSPQPSLLSAGGAFWGILPPSEPAKIRWNRHIFLSYSASVMVFCLLSPAQPSVFRIKWERNKGGKSLAVYSMFTVRDGCLCKRIKITVITSKNVFILVSVKPNQVVE